MNFTYITNLLILFIFSILLFSCNTKKLYEKMKIQKYEIPVVENLDPGNITIYQSKIQKINYEKKYTLGDFKNNNNNSINVIIIDSRVFAINQNIELLEFDYDTGKLISSNKIKTNNETQQIITSFIYVDNSFIISLKSGLILRVNYLGEIIWQFYSNKILNTPIIIFDNQILSLYADEIKCISLSQGKEIWSELYEDMPVYQAKGGQMVNFFNLLYFILPNNKVGSIDFNLGSPHNSEFNNIPLISSLNNINDKIHIYENYLIYLDEGKYLYVFDIFINDFILFKKNIHYSSSNMFFNNALIIKDGNYLQAINIINGNTLWLIDSNKISKKSTIKDIININDNIKIFLSNGDILNVNNKKLTEINSIGIKKINRISIQDINIIINTESDKTIIF